MKPGGNIYTDGTYYKKHPTWDEEDSEWKASKILALIKKNNLALEEITDLGCGAGAILYHLANQMPGVKQFRGYDISPDAINLAKKFESERIQFKKEEFLVPGRSDYSDLLLLIDVLEHIEDYYGFIKSIRPRSRYFIFHIPLDLSCRTVLKPHVLLQQRTSVGHLHYFTEEMILWLLDDAGYTIIDWQFTKPVGDVQNARSIKQHIKKLLRNISFKMNEHLTSKLWGGYSMLILAKGNNEQ